MRNRILISLLLLLLPAAAPAARAEGFSDATPTAWHQLARAESLLSAPEPPHPVAVCVVDSGVNITPDLEGVVVERLAYDGGDPGDTYPQEGIDDGHGTYVATFLAGQVNGWGGAGTWPRAKIVSVRVFPPGGVRAKAADYVRAMEICRQRPDVRVINFSLGDLDGSAAELRELEDRLTDYRRNGNINIVAAAGNRNAAVEMPAAYPGAFAVAAIDSSGAFCAFSSRGPEVDVLAPGCDLQGADQHGQAVSFNGTSFAAPMVSAALAAVRAYGGLSAAAGEEVLLETARPVAAGVLLDVDRALAAVGVGSENPPQRQPPPSFADGIPRSTEEFPRSGDWVDLPAPRGRAIYHRSRRELKVVVRNRPPGAAIEARFGRNDREVRRSRLRVKVTRRPLSIRLRFISDLGTSAWSRMRVRPFTNR